MPLNINAGFLSGSGPHVDGWDPWTVKLKIRTAQCYCLLAEHPPPPPPQKGEGTYRWWGRGLQAVKSFLVWYFISTEMTICGAGELLILGEWWVLTGGTLTSSFDWPLLKENRVEGCWCIVYRKAVWTVFLCVLHRIFCQSRERKWSVFFKYFFDHLLPFVLRHTPKLLIWLGDIFMSLRLPLVQVLKCQCHLAGWRFASHTSETAY